MSAALEDLCFEVRRDILTAAITAGVAALFGFSAIAGYKHAQLERTIFHDCERRDGIGTETYV